MTKKTQATLLLLTVLTTSCASTKPIERSPSFIGGSRPSSYPPGVIRLGARGVGTNDFQQSTYIGGKARFRNERNSFFNTDDSTFGSETKVSVELANVGNDITYIGKGDSGGGVFAVAGRDYHLLAVNQAGYFGQGQGLRIDAHTGAVLERPRAVNSDILGFAHRFSSANRKLMDWVSRILPRDSYVIER